MDVSQKSLCKALDLTPQRVNQLATEGIVTKVARGKYDLYASTAGYIKYLRTQVEQSKQGGEVKKKADEEKAVVQTELLKIELALKQKEAIRTDDVLRILAPVFKSISQTLRGIPKHAARELGNKDIEVYLDKFITNALNDLAGIPDTFKRLRSDAEGSDSHAHRSPASAAKAHRKRVGRSISVSQRRGKRRKR